MWSGFKFNNLGLALGTNLRFYTSVAKVLRLKVRKFLGLILRFVEITREKLVGLGGLFSIFIFCLEPIDKDDFRHYYGIFFDFLNYLVTGIFKVLLQQLQGTLTTAFKTIHYS